MQPLLEKRRQQAANHALLHDTRLRGVNQVPENVSPFSVVPGSLYPNAGGAQPTREYFSFRPRSRWSLRNMRARCAHPLEVPNEVGSRSNVYVVLSGDLRTMRGRRPRQT